VATRKRLPPARSIGRFALTPSRRATVRAWLARARSGPEFVHRFVLLVRRQVRVELVAAGWSNGRIAKWLGPVRPFGTRTTAGRGFKLRLATTGEQVFLDPLATLVPRVVQRCAWLVRPWSSAYQRAGNMTDRALWYQGVGIVLVAGGGGVDGRASGKSQRGQIRQRQHDGYTATVGESLQGLMRNLHSRPGSPDETGVMNETRGFLARLDKYGDAPAIWIRFVGISPITKHTWDDWEKK